MISDIKNMCNKIRFNKLQLIQIDIYAIDIYRQLLHILNI